MVGALLPLPGLSTTLRLRMMRPRLISRGLTLSSRDLTLTSRGLTLRLRMRTVSEKEGGRAVSAAEDPIG